MIALSLVKKTDPHFLATSCTEMRLAFMAGFLRALSVRVLLLLRGMSSRPVYLVWIEFEAVCVVIGYVSLRSCLRVCFTIEGCAPESNVYILCSLPSAKAWVYSWLGV